MKILFKSIKIVLAIGIAIALALAGILLFFGEDPSEYASFVDKEIEEMEGSIYTAIESELESMDLQDEGTADQTGIANDGSGTVQAGAGSAGDDAAQDTVLTPDPGIERKIRQMYANAFLELEASAISMLKDLE